MRDSMRPSERLGDQVLHNHTVNPDPDKDVEYTHEALPHETSRDATTQAGVKRIEAVSKAWTKTSLIIAYIS